MIELKDYQKKAVRELKEKLVELLNDEGDRQKLIFKAPTGAGKTVMASMLLDEVTRELPIDGKCIYTQVAWVWIAPNKLHQQSYRSMRNFFSERRSLRPVMFDECDHLEGLQKGDVLFLNWESINKDNAVMIRDNEQNRTLYELIRRTRIERRIPIVVIIDEEHMFGGRNARKSEIVLQSILPKVELRISATPVTNSFHNVLVKRKDVVEEEMIKRGIQLNPNVHSSKEQSELTVNQRLLKRALAKREEIAKAYKQHGINPLLLIQLPNDSSESLNANERTIADEMKAYLGNLEHPITAENGKLAVWLSKDKSPNLQSITKADDMTEVLLFKQAIALGWDCPRASVLLIFRELQSMTFTTQTVGRILRMPEQRFYQNDLLNYGYVYTNLSADIIQIVGDDMNYISTVYANRRSDLENITLRSAYIDHRTQRNRLGSTFRSVFTKVMETEWEQSPLMLFSFEDMFGTDDEEVDSQPDNDDLSEKVKYNQLNAKKHGVRCEVSNILVDVPKDTRITNFDGTTEIVEKARIAKNASELRDMFVKFCRDNVGGYAKFDSTPVLMGAIEYALENYLNVFPTDVPKVVLQRNNKPHFEELIRRALLEYGKTLEQAKPTEAAYKETTWEVPETRNYNSQVCQSKEGEIFCHALQPFFEANKVSKPEYDFARWIDAHTETVDWWYKNGDEGKQHFAVPYTDSANHKRCFYVDFIIRLKNSTICLFDTKTCGSDEDAPEKNNALYNYCKEYCEKGKKVVGGVLINQGDNWYYPNGLIDNTDSISSGWSVLNFNEM